MKAHVALLLAIAAANAAFVAAAQDSQPEGHDMTASNARTPPPEDTGYDGPPVTMQLHGHIFDLLQPVPINTQPMIDEDLARGFGTPVVPGVIGEGLSEMRFYSSPGLVEYNASAEEPRVHPERGLSYDVELDPNQDVLAYWYMSVKPGDVPQAGSPAEGGPEGGLMPNLVVRVTMRVGDDIGSDLDGGEIIAQGETVLPPEAWMVEGVQEFVVNLGKALRNIPGDGSFNVKVEWFNLDANGEKVTQRDWVLHTGARYPNRLEVPVVNPIAVYFIHPVPVGRDRIAIHSMMNSPLGNYDVDPASITIGVTGPSEVRSLSDPLIVQKSWVHNHHFEPVTVAWTWDWRADDAEPGDYTITVSATNLQGTATATKSYTFRLEGDRVFDAVTGEEITPSGTDAEAAAREASLPALLPLAALAAGFLLSGRWRR